MAYVAMHTIGIFRIVVAVEFTGRKDKTSLMHFGEELLNIKNAQKLINLH